MLILFFALFLCFFPLSDVGLEGSSFMPLFPSAMADSIQVSPCFWTLSRAFRNIQGKSTVGQDGSYWLWGGGIATLGPHGTNNPNTHAHKHNLINKKRNRLGHQGWVGISCGRAKTCVCRTGGNMFYI